MGEEAWSEAACPWETGGVAALEGRCPHRHVPPSIGGLQRDSVERATTGSVSPPPTLRGVPSMQGYRSPLLREMWTAALLVGVNRRP